MAPLILTALFLLYYYQMMYPRYLTTWDPAIVVQYLKALPSTSEHSLEMMPLKLGTLMALTTAHRIQTLSLLRVFCLRFITSKV